MFRLCGTQNNDSSTMPTFCSLEPLYALLNRKKKGTFQMWSWDSEIILGYLDGLMLLVSGKGRQEFQNQRYVRILCCWFWRWRKGPWTKEGRWSLEAGKSKKMDPVLQHQLLLTHPFPCLNFRLVTCLLLHSRAVLPTA